MSCKLTAIRSGASERAGELRFTDHESAHEFRFEQHGVVGTWTSVTS